MQMQNDADKYPFLWSFPSADYGTVFGVSESELLIKQIRKALAEPVKTCRDGTIYTITSRPRPLKERLTRLRSVKSLVKQWWFGKDIVFGIVLLLVALVEATARIDLDGIPTRTTKKPVFRLESWELYV